MTRTFTWRISEIVHDNAVRAAVDVTQALNAVPLEEWRLVGGMGVAVLCGTSAQTIFEPRITPDADVGISAGLHSPEVLVSRLEAAGFTRSLGSRFVRTRDANPVIVDIVAPARFPGTRGSRDAVRRIGSITATAAPGLAFALGRPPVVIGLSATLTDGDTAVLTLPVPDELAFLIMKLGVYAQRTSHEDARDIASILELIADSEPEIGAWTDSDAEARASAATARTFFLAPRSTGATAFPAARRTELRAVLAELLPG